MSWNDNETPLLNAGFEQVSSMKKTPILIESKFILSPAIILSILFMPFFTYAGTYYRCVGKAGDISITDYPIDGNTCKPVGTFIEMTDEERMKDKREREDQEEKRTEEYEKRIADEDAQRKSADTLAECYEEARLRHMNCTTQTFNTYDQTVATAMLMRCDYNHQQERNKCLQQDLQKP